jgi:hypothetical protein
VLSNQYRGLIFPQFAENSGRISFQRRYELGLHNSDIKVSLAVSQSGPLRPWKLRRFAVKQKAAGLKGAGPRYHQ